MSRDRDDDRGRGRDRDDRGSSRGRDRDDDRGSSRGRDRDDDRGRGSRDDDRGSRGRDRDDDRGSRGRDRDDRDDRGSGSSSKFTYRQRTADEVKERGSMGAREYDKMLKPGVKMFTPGDGDNRIRLLPPTWDGAKHYGYDVYVHYGVGPDRESYICPQQHDRGPCPICEERDAARRENNPDEDYIKELEPKRRVLDYLIDRNNEREGVQAWMSPWTVDKDITKVSVDKGTGEVLPIDHPEDGYDVEFEKTGKGRNTKYDAVAIARRSSPLGRPAWLDHVMDNPLPDQLQFYDYATIAKTFGAKGQQRDARDDRDRDDDRGSSRGRDRDDGRGSRDRDDRSGRDRDDRSSRDREDDFGGRSRDRDDRSSSSRREDDEPTWESVHRMTRTELEDLVEFKVLPIKPREAKDDDDLADWVCEEMKLKPSEERRERRKVEEDPPARGTDDRMAEMRRRRAD